MPAHAMPKRVSQLVTAVILVAVVAGLVSVLRPDSTKTVQVRFERAVGLYAGSDVRLHGIKIGSITKVTPDGDGVLVKMKYDKDIKLPAYSDDAKVVRAAIIPPSLVSDRYVQLADFDSCASGCPVLAGGAAIPMSQTAAPVELDDIYAALDKLNVALGPKGANSSSSGGKGPLSNLIDVGAANLDGNGAALGSTVQDLSKAVRTLSEGREDLFGTVKNLQVFTDALVANDAQVRKFNTQLDQVTSSLAQERGSLAAALKNLNAALRDIAGFLKTHGDSLHADIVGMKKVVGVLNKQRAALNEVLAVAPVALSNLNHTYNAAAGTLDTRDNLGGTQNPLDPAVICAALKATKNLPATGVIADTCTAIAKVIGGLPILNGTPGVGGLIGLPPLGGS
ncbi:MAG TPA: MCE family protein [Jatrophihabitans sp.]|jgi:phospholipid/cholesterol/gamma-HCH transport system substrate-binding protein|uniref:MCE family protein n=1 Tax=Jatrophihabitans sp. TaxID=1932789 RepID=UPI002F22BD2B